MALKFLNNGYFAGKVGIGTESPENKLHVQQSALYTGIQSTAGIRIKSDGASAIGNYHGTIALSKGTGSVAISAVQEGTDSDRMGMAFFTHPSATGSAAAVEQMRIDENGNVGIGTTSPASKLHVSSSGDTILRVTSADGNAAFLDLGDASDPDGGRIVYDSGSNLALYTASSERMRIDSSGNVGIGTTSPSFKLDVTGDGIRNVRSTAGWAGWFENTNNSSGVIVTAGVDSGDAPLLIRKQDGTELFSVRGNGTSWFNNGNVGIGTTNPGEKLEVSGSNTLSIKLSRNNTDATYVTTLTNNFSSSLGTELKSGTYNILTHGNSTGTALNFTNGAMTFDFRNSEYMRITEAGKVGIGTTSPGTYAKLEVSTSQQYGGIVLSNGTNNVGWISGNSASNDNGQLSLSSGGVQKVQINAASNSYFNGGNVGIGTTGPGYKLEINSGTTNVTSAFKSTDNQAWISIQDDDSGTYGALIGIDSDESENFVVANASASKMLSLNSSGSLKLHNYNSTNNTGTPTYLLGTDGSGNIVKTNTVPGSAAGPYLPLAGGTMTGTNGVVFPDNFILNIGTANDLTIKHNATDSFIENHTGHLSVVNYSNDKDIIFWGDDGTGGIAKYLVIDGANEVNQFYKDASFYDGIRANFGNSNDLQIYHDGSDSYIEESGTGRLILSGGSDIQLQSPAGELMGDFNGNGSVDLYYNNSKKFETTNIGVTVTGDIKIQAALLSNQDNTDVDTGTETVANVAIATYTAAFFDFVIKKSTNVRSGTVYACHDGTNVQFTETSTQDLGNTSDVTLSVDISGGNMRLRATSLSESWSVKSLIRAI